LILTSCSFADNDVQTPSLKDDKDRLVTIKANFSIDQSAPKTMKNAAALSRSATADMPNSISYFVTAETVETPVQSVNVPENDINVSEGTFTINLLTGYTWKITVGIKDTATDAIILKDSHEETITIENLALTHLYSLKPQITSGEYGSVLLSINKPNDYTLSISDEENLFQNWNTNLTQSGTTATLNINQIPSGRYVLKLTFSKENAIPFITTQIITVYDNLKTNTWLSGGNALIDNSGNFTLTDTIINTATENKLIYYVDGTGNIGNDNNTGNANNPLKTISRAISLINAVGDNTKNYKIYVKNGTTENNISEALTIEKKVTIETYSNIPGDAGGSASLTAAASGLTESLFTVGSSKSLSLTGISLYGNNTSISAITVNSSGTLTMNSGSINYFSASGIKVNGNFFFYGGSITNNKAAAGETSAAGGITLSSTGSMYIKGNVRAYNNYLSDGTTPSNIYLPNGKKIYVNGVLNSESKLGITTQNPPTNTSHIQITNNYSSKNSSIDPGTIFKGDCYGIKTHNGEAVSIANGGQLIKQFSDTVNISFSIGSGSSGVDQQIILTLKVNGEETTPPEGWNVSSIICNGSNYNTSTFYSLTGNELTLKSSLMAGTYYVTVSVRINSIDYKTTKKIILTSD